MINKIREIYIKHEEIVNYVVAGGCATVVSIGSYFIFRQIGVSYLWANALSWVCAVTFAFFTNRKFVFKSKNNKYKEMVKFFLSRVATLLIEIIFMYLLVDICKINDGIVKLLLQVIVLLLNYIFSKIFVFKK